MRIVIIGGGITGLAAAYYVHRHRPGHDVTLLEAGSRLGGKILTDRIDGFVIEGGPDSFLSSKPWAISLCEELGLTGEMEGTLGATRRASIMRDGQLYEIPDGLSGLVPSRLEPLLTSPLFTEEGKHRLAQEESVPPRQDDADESLGDFVSRRFGTEVYERLIEPLMTGIYGGDGQQLSISATFPQLRDLERRYGSILRGIQQRPAAPKPPAYPPFVTFRNGMATLVEHLASALPRHSIRTGAGVRTVEPGYRIRLSDGAQIEADAVIVATPAHTSADLLQYLDSDLSELLATIPYVSSATASLAFRNEEIAALPEGHGYIVPRRENRAVIAASWSSQKFAHRAPPGYTLARAFVGRAGEDDLPDEGELIDLARREFVEVAGIRAQPVLARAYRWPAAMPQYTLGHLDRLAKIDKCLNNLPGLILAGSAYGGVGIPDCIRSGQEAAKQLD